MNAGGAAGIVLAAAGPARIPRALIPGLVQAYDAAAVFAAALVSLALYSSVNPEYRYEPAPVAAIAAAASWSTAVVLRYLDVYSFEHMAAWRWQAGRVAGACGLVTVGGLFVAFLTKTSEDLSRLWVLLWVAAALLLLMLGRAVLARLIRNWRAAGRLRHRVVLLGGAEASCLAGELRRVAPDEVEILGIFDDVDALLAGTRIERVDEVVIALPLSDRERIEAARRRLQRVPVDVALWLNVPGTAAGFRGFRSQNGIPFVELGERPLKDWKAVKKRALDVAGAGILVFLLAPLLAAVAMLVRLESPGPALFRQKRFGFNQKPIEVLKFRTMYADRCDDSGASRTRRNDRRVTPLGRWLRRTSLDELPQLFNVLGGSMSLVGPRPHPLVMKAGDALYQDAVQEYFARHRVKPGITGWAQVNGCRGEIDTVEKARRRVELDLQYIERWSTRLDLGILARTPTALFGRGVY